MKNIINKTAYVSFFILTCFLTTSRGFAQTGTPASAIEGSAPKAVYYCVPMYAWDTGYHVAINYDELKNQFKAKIYAVDFFGKRPIINEDVQFAVGKNENAGQQSNSCVFSFNQKQPTRGHSVSFRDFAHHEFAMELRLQGLNVDPSNKTLRCKVAPWFVEQFKGCN